MVEDTRVRWTYCACCHCELYMSVLSLLEQWTMQTVGRENEQSCHFTELLCQSVRLPERTSHQEAKLSLKTQWSTGTRGLYRNAQAKFWQVYPCENDLTQAIRGTKASWNSQVTTSQESHFAFHLEKSRGSGFPKSFVSPRRKSISKTPFPNEVHHPPFLP